MSFTFSVIYDVEYNTTYDRKVRRLNALQTNQEQPASSVSNCKLRCLLGVLQLLTDSIRHRRLELRATGKWFLLHQNAPPHTTVKGCPSVYQITELLHAPYSPDLSPCDFFLFPRLHRALKGHPYADSLVIQMTATKQVCNIPVLSTIASKTPPTPKEHWKRYVHAGSFAQKCKYTVLNFMPPVSELSGHLLSFFYHSLNNPLSITNRSINFPTFMLQEIGRAHV